jgi:hypothetical protein
MKLRTIRILREQSKFNPLAAHAEAVYRWASHLTAETRYTDPESYKDYFLTASARSLHFKLTHMEQGLVGVIGLQGVGKTSTLQKLAYDLNTSETSAIFIRWVADWQKIIEANPRIARAYKSTLNERLHEKEEAYGRTFRRMPGLGGKVPDLTDLGRLERGEISLETMEATLGKNESKKVMEEAIISTLAFTRYVFIDLPDYSKKTKSAMNEDLETVDNLWKRATQIAGDDMRTIFVIGIQKEMYGGHFLFGKMVPVVLSPMKIEEMVAAYKQKWVTIDPFTEESLKLLAQKSRGIFRRFLKYIMMCIEGAAGQDLPITVEIVNRSITLDVLNADMDLELTDVFQNNREHKMMAVKTLAYLSNKNANQKDVAEMLDADETATGRLVKKLETYGYLKRERGAHGAWVLSLP